MHFISNMKNVQFKCRMYLIRITYMQEREITIIDATNFKKRSFLDPKSKCKSLKNYIPIFIPTFPFE